MSLEDLRKRAEAAVNDGEPGEELPELSLDLLRQLVHELSVHEVELRIQNEQLRERELELERTRDRYLELFDLAPIGYATLDAKAVIREANSCLVEWLGRTRDEVVGHALSAFIDPSATTSFEMFRRSLFEGEPQVSLEVDFVGTRARLPASVRGVRLDPNDALVAILDVRAEREARELEERFSHRLLELRDRDNMRLATELHDGIGQSLSAVGVGLRSFELGAAPELAARLQALREIVSKSTGALRRLARGLYASSVDDLGLGRALEGLIRDTQSVIDLDVSLDVQRGSHHGPTPELDELPPRVARLVFNVAREGLSNALRHAGATKAFEGFGLKSLSARARALEGTLEVNSAPGQGTALRLRLVLGETVAGLSPA